MMLPSKIGGCHEHRYVMLLIAAASVLSSVTQLPVGQVTTPGTVGYRGSAVLIGPCHALSARHVFLNNLARRVQFRSGDIVSDGQVVQAGYGLSTDPLDWSGDWALIRLPSCPGAQLGFIPLGSALSGPEIVVGTWDHRNMRPLVQHCRFAGVYERSFLTTCGVRPGDSGGTVVGVDWLTHQPVVMGVVTAGTWDKPRRLAVGNEILQAAVRHQIDHELASFPSDRKLSRTGDNSPNPSIGF